MRPVRKREIGRTKFREGRHIEQIDRPCRFRRAPSLRLTSRVERRVGNLQCHQCQGCRCQHILRHGEGFNRNDDSRPRQQETVRRYADGCNDAGHGEQDCIGKIRIFLFRDLSSPNTRRYCIVAPIACQADQSVIEHRRASRSNGLYGLDRGRQGYGCQLEKRRNSGKVCTC